MPIVSVIVTCFNYGLFLEETVDSVLEQTFRDFEIIIVDDGSTDGSADVARKIIDDNPEICIRLIAQNNSGVSNARNNGIKEARGKYFMPLDGDDKLKPEFLERTVDILDANPDRDFTYTEFELFGDGDSSFRKNPVDRTYDFEKLKTYCYIINCCLFRKSAWEEVGGYNENLPGYEDWEFLIALGEAGHAGLFIDEPLFLYRSHSSSKYNRTYGIARKKLLHVMLSHPRLYSPALSKLGLPTAKTSIYVRVMLLAPVRVRLKNLFKRLSSWLYSVSPGIHCMLKRIVKGSAG